MGSEELGVGSGVWRLGSEGLKWMLPCNEKIVAPEVLPSKVSCIVYIDPTSIDHDGTCASKQTSKSD